MPVVVAFSIFHVILFILVSCYRKDKACLRYIMLREFDISLNIIY